MMEQRKTLGLGANYSLLARITTLCTSCVHFCSAKILALYYLNANLKYIYIFLNDPMIKIFLCTHQISSDMGIVSFHYSKLQFQNNIRYFVVIHTSCYMKENLPYISIILDLAPFKSLTFQLIFYSSLQNPLTVLCTFNPFDIENALQFS